MYSLPPLQYWYLKNELLKRDMDVSLIDNDLTFHENKAIIEKETGLQLASEDTLIKAHDRRFQAAMDQIAGDEPAKKSAKIPESTLKIETIAKKIAEKGDVVRFLVNQTQKNHKGDIDAIKTLFASVASTNSGTSAGIQPGINGNPGQGKSDAAKAVLHLIPDNWKKVATLTATAIYYDKSIWPGTIIASDDVEWSDGLIATMKRSMGDFQNPQEKMNVSVQREALPQTMPQRIVWWVTCVESVANNQLKDRQHSLDIDEEFEHVKFVSKFTGVRRSKKSIRFNVDLGIEVARWIINDIKNHELFKVVIDCAEVAEWKIVEDHRAQNKFWDLVEAFAILRYRQRIIDGDGWLHATVQDFNDAKEIMNKRTENHRTHLTGPQIKVIQSIIKLQSYSGVTQARIAEDIHRSIVSVSTALKAIETNTSFVVHERKDGVEWYRCTVTDFSKMYKGEMVSLPADYQDPFLGDLSSDLRLADSDLSSVLRSGFETKIDSSKAIIDII